MGLFDLLFGSSQDDRLEGFLSPFFGAQRTDQFRGQNSPHAFGGIPLQAPVLPKQPAYTDPRGRPRYWPEEVEGKDFAADPALYAAIDSELPGLEDAPADAFRHMVLAAELTRLYGASIASDILDEHEKSGRHLDGWTQDAENMDRRNNTVGMRIGKTAKDLGDVLRQAEVMMKSAAPDGSGGWRDPNNHAPIPAPIWLPRDRWKGAQSGPGTNWYDNSAHPGTLVFPEIWPDLKTYPYGGAEHTYNGSVSAAIEGWLGAHYDPYIRSIRRWVSRQF
jgi:hypothetical protein